MEEEVKIVALRSAINEKLYHLLVSERYAPLYIGYSWDDFETFTTLCHTRLSLESPNLPSDDVFVGFLRTELPHRTNLVRHLESGALLVPTDLAPMFLLGLPGSQVIDLLRFVQGRTYDEFIDSMIERSGVYQK